MIFTYGYVFAVTIMAGACGITFNRAARLRGRLGRHAAQTQGDR